MNSAKPFDGAFFVVIAMIAGAAALYGTGERTAEDKRMLMEFGQLLVSVYLGGKSLVAVAEAVVRRKAEPPAGQRAAEEEATRAAIAAVPRREDAWLDAAPALKPEPRPQFVPSRPSASPFRAVDTRHQPAPRVDISHIFAQPPLTPEAKPAPETKPTPETYETQ